MNQKSAWLRCKKISFFLQLILGCMFLLLMPKLSLAQKQLTVSNKVEKVAFIDHSRLRKEYKEFADAMKKIATENNTKQKAHDEALAVLDKQHHKKLRSDSLKGGKQHDKILSENSAKRTTMIDNYQAGLKQRMQHRLTLINDYERKIQLATETVVSEGGFTDIKPLDKEPSKQRGANVTDLILKKLN